MIVLGVITSFLVGVIVGFAGAIASVEYLIDKGEIKVKNEHR